MPVSSPSYFPPNRSNGTVVGLTAGTNTTGSRNFLALKAAGLGATISDLIIIGDQAGAAGLTDVNHAGSILIGSNAGHALVDSAGAPAEGVTLIGFNAGAALVHGGATTLVGWKVLPSIANDNTGVIGRNLVCVGSNIGLTGNYGTLHESVLIGTDISVNPAGGAFSALTASVIIGHQAANVGPNAAGYNGSVIIGYTTASSCVQLTNATLVGANINTSGNFMGDMTVVGASITLTGGPQKCVYLGSQIKGLGNNNNVFIGFGANPGSTSYSDTFLLDVSGSGSLLYGSFASGNLVVGRSSEGTNRDFAGGAINSLKLISGSKGASNPLGGGYCYVDGANNTNMPVRWVDATGADTSLTSSGGRLLATGSGVITPAALAAGNTNHYAPAGLAQAQVVRLSGDAGGSTLQGLSSSPAQIPGRFITLSNVSANAITLAHAAGVAGVDQFLLPGAVNLVLSQFSCVRLWYDSTLTGWISLGRSN